MRPSGDDRIAPATARATQLWHVLRPQQVAEHWGVDLERGHSSEQATRLLDEYGANQLSERVRASLPRRIFDQIKDVTVMALLAAAVLAAVVARMTATAGESWLERYGDTAAIVVIVMLNAVLGLLQQRRAERALAALRQMTSPRARVRRAERWSDVDATMLVPGDVIALREGDRVPADARLITIDSLELSEAALTGEAFAVDKDADAVLEADTPLAERTTMVFMGTEVVRGRAEAIVVGTGMSTELGNIARALSEVDVEPTPLQRYLNRFGRLIVLACVAISAAVFAVGLIHGRQSLSELLLTSVSLAVAAIPEGLPAITAIVLALGAQRMARRQALVRRLPAVEGLGSAHVICTDKTGTLTQGVMSVRCVYASGKTYHVTGEARRIEGSFSTPGAGAEAELDPRHETGLWRLLQQAAHVRDVTLQTRSDGTIEASGNPTDTALAIMALKADLAAPPPAQLVRELSFSSARKMGTLIVEQQGRQRALIKGAPEVVLARCSQIWGPGGVEPLSEERRAALLDLSVRWGADAMRVLALASREEQPGSDEGWEEQLTLTGLVGIVDPLRPEVREAMHRAHGAGVTTVMITGDHPATARSIARDLELGGADNEDVLSGADVEQLSPSELVARLERARVVARATPLHKLRIVEAFKAHGRVCAMTGDGVNDGPAVKAASIGVAMGRAGADVTRQAADLVLADDNYATIVAAIEEGRAIFSNIKRFIFFLLSSNTSIVLVVFLAGLLGWAPPLAPIQILWINLITNGLPALALGVERNEPGLMSEPPRDPKAPVLSRHEYLLILGTGTLMGASALVVYLLLGGASADLSHAQHRLAQTACFAVLSLAPMFHAFNCRSWCVPNARLGWLSNRSLLAAVAIGIALIAVAIYVPGVETIFETRALGLYHLALVIGLSMLTLVVIEPIKLYRCRRGLTNYRSTHR